MSDLTVATADGVALLTLNRPERRNAYTETMGAQLGRAYRQYGVTRRPRTRHRGWGRR